MMNMILKKGDIIFRQGNPSFSKFIGTPYTHCGILVDTENIHDLYNKGLRIISLSDFIKEADNSSEISIVRPKSKYFSESKIMYLIESIHSNSTIIPHSKQPWNVFSSSIGYENSGCIKYCLHNYLSLLDYKAEIHPTYVEATPKHAQVFAKMINKNGVYSDDFDNRFESEHHSNNKYPVITYSSLINSVYFDHFTCSL